MRRKYTLSVAVLAVASLILVLFPVSGAANGTWEMLARDGIDSPTNSQLLPITAFKGQVYTAVFPNFGGTPPPGVMFSYDGMRLKKVVDDGFGDPDNMMLFPFAVYQGKLFAGTGNFMSGAQLWSYDGTSWSKVADGGFGDPPDYIAYPIGVFKDRLLISTQGNGIPCSLFAYDGVSVTKIAGDGFGNPNSTDAVALSDPSDSEMLITARNPDGLEVFSFDGTSLRKLADRGLGDPNNLDAKVVSYNPLDGAFYFGTSNYASGAQVFKYKDGRFAKLAENGLGNPNTTSLYTDFRGGTIYLSGGYEGPPDSPINAAKIFRMSKDGTFKTVVPDGFGDPGNIDTLSLVSWNGYQYAGTMNANGGQLWRAEVSPTLLDIEPAPKLAAGAGSPAGSRVILSGFDFHPKKGKGKVTFAGVEAKTSYWSDDTILAEVPAGAVSGEVRVVTTGGESNALEYDVTIPDTWFFAEGSTRDNPNDGSYDTYLCIQNPGKKSRKVDVTFLLEGKDKDLPDFMVAPKSRLTVNARDYLGSDVDMASIVSADGPVIVERPMYFDYRGKWEGGHVAMGVPVPRSTWYFAEGTTRSNGTDGSFEEWLTLLNPGVSSAKVDITYMLDDGSTKTQKVSVGAGDRATVDVNTAVGPDRDVSMMVESSVPVVAERPMYFDYRDMWDGGDVIAGVPEAGREFYFAEGTTRDNEADGTFQEWLCLQNPGSKDADVTITYMTGSGGPKKQEVFVPARSRRTVDVNGFLGRDVDNSMKVESDRPIVAERPMYFSYRSAWNGGHVVAGSPYPRRNWYFAEGSTRDNPEDGTFDEYICIQNPGAGDVDVEIAFQYGEAGGGRKTITLGPRRRHTIDVVSLVGRDKDVSVIVVSADDEVVCERAMYFDYHGRWAGGHASPGYGI